MTVNGSVLFFNVRNCAKINSHIACFDKGEIFLKYLTLGILAHVDAGKTTLSESLLFESGMIHKAGRVDHKDAFLDTHDIEKERGITVFSKQAVIDYGDMRITLVDTPGHTDFKAETERALMVLDGAILVISSLDGVTGHTAALYNLLKKYGLPVFVFFNKMDIEGSDKSALMEDIRAKLSGSFADLSGGISDPEIQEELALCDEGLMERYLEGKELITGKEAAALVKKGALNPCYFGSALRLEGVRELMEGVKEYLPERKYSVEPSFKVYKIATDEKNTRLTFAKITGGSYEVKSVVPEYGEKIEEIRIYSGKGYENIKEARAGMLVAFTGLKSSKTADAVGGGYDEVRHTISEPVLRYKVISKDGTDPNLLLSRLRKLEEEDPALHISWEEEKREIQICLMGQVQLEIVQRLMLERFGEHIDFMQGSILYKETIADTVEGAGHFEPLRHYAEVHLILEPLEEGSGVVIDNICDNDLLAKNWQNLILTHLTERTFKGKLTGSEITDIKITLASGKAHLKHTEGGDFRQATYRAVRNGIMKAKGVLLEPWYDFELTIPEETIGRAMTDLSNMGAEFKLSENKTDSKTLIKGLIPAKEGMNYADELKKYTKDEGRIELNFAGYNPCHDEEEVIAETGYDPERDLRNTGDSVFCSHGAGVIIPWYEADEHMHLPSVLAKQTEDEQKPVNIRRSEGVKALSVDEIDAIIERTYYSNRKKAFKNVRTAEMQLRSTLKDEADVVKGESSPRNDKYRDREKQQKVRPGYVLIDGYNVIFSWEDLNELAKLNIDSARDALLDIMCNYRGLKEEELIVVFDAYRVQGHDTEFLDHNNIHVVYTKEAQTADSYIEHFSHEHARHYDITVVTSDKTEQVIVLGAGCRVKASDDFRTEVIRQVKEASEEYTGHRTPSVNSMEGQFDEIILN